MSAQTAAPVLPTLDISQTPRTPFSRMVGVETRKMFDTRAGLWLFLITGLLLVAAGVISLLVALLNEGIDLTGADLSQIMVIPLSLLLPVLAILSVTSEWSQRTGLVTFTHEPHRMRVIAAKAVSVAVLVLGIVVVAVALGALTNVLYAALNGSDAVWNLDGTVLAWTLVTQLLFFAMAFGMAMLFLNTPATVAVYYVVALLVPFMIYGPVIALVSWGPDVIPWIDLAFATAPLTSPGDLEDAGKTYAQVAVASGIWVVLPILIGSMRVSRAEIK